METQAIPAGLPDEEWEAMRAEILAVELELATGKYEYVVNGVDGDFKRKTWLHMRRAELSLILHKEKGRREALKRQAQQLKAHTFLALLCKKMEDLGHAEEIQKAQAESLAVLEPAGLLDYYLQRKP